MNVVLIFLLLAPIALIAGEKTISPKVSESFGTKITIEATFTPKNRTYFEQNLIKTQYMLQVIKVNGKALNEPKRIEYRWEEDASVEEGKVYELEAYESLYPMGDPREWNEFPSQIDYHINTYLIIRKPKS